MANHTDPILGTEASSCPDCGALKCLCRPRFFAGQLLSEEDLNRLDRYLVQKQRLHNRYLHGWGVACGLEVGCDPCDQRLVTVSPGYALDPCGADVIVCRESKVPVCKLIEDCRRAERTRAPCGPYDAASDCPQAEETWILAIRYTETPTRGVSALRRSADRCDPAQAGSPPPREAPPQCEPRILCEDHVYEVYRAPDHTADEGHDRGALVERVRACAQGLFTGFPQFPELVSTRLLEPPRYDYVLVESAEGIQAGYILRVDPGQETEEAVRVDHVNGNQVHLTDLLNQEHDNGAVVAAFDPSAWSRLCCQIIAHYKRFLLGQPGRDCTLLERLNCVLCPDPHLEAQAYVQAWERAWIELSSILGRLLYDCLCSALLPPCPAPTDEERVPLAAITVSPGECRVLDVCNWTRERKLLVTFPNLRYWFSWLPIGRWMRQMLETMCCGLDIARVQLALPVTEVPAMHHVPANHMNTAEYVDMIDNTGETVGNTAVHEIHWAGSPGGETVSVLLQGLLGAPIAPRDILDSLVGVPGEDGQPPLSPEALDNLTQLLLLNRMGRPLMRNLSPLFGSLGGRTGSSDREIAGLREQVAQLTERLNRLETDT